LVRIHDIQRNDGPALRRGSRAAPAAAAGTACAAAPWREWAVRGTRERL